MQQFIISAPIFLIFIYFCIICSNHLSQQKFSALKTDQNQLNSTKFRFRPATAQATPENSLPRNKFSPPNNNQQIQKSIPHKQIILFSSNSFAILSIPYSKFKKMLRPTSPRQHKKIQKVIKGQGKSFHKLINPATPILSMNNKYMEESSLFPPNLNHRATQEPPKPAQNPHSHLEEFNAAKLNLQVDYNLQPATAPPEDADSTKSNPPTNCQPQIKNTTTQPQKPSNNLISPIDIFFQTDTIIPSRNGNAMTALSAVHHTQNSQQNHKQHRNNIANTTELTSTVTHSIQCIPDDPTRNNSNLIHHNPPHQHASHMQRNNNNNQTTILANNSPTNNTSDTPYNSNPVMEPTNNPTTQGNYNSNNTHTDHLSDKTPTYHSTSMQKHLLPKTCMM